MVEITLEEYEIRAGQVQEQIWRLIGQIPEGVAGAPEWVLLVHPLAFTLIRLQGKRDLARRTVI